jgi:hypothetical protein
MEYIHFHHRINNYYPMYQNISNPVLIVDEGTTQVVPYEPPFLINKDKGITPVVSRLMFDHFVLFAHSLHCESIWYLLFLITSQ